MTLLGLVSDTHDNLAPARTAARFFREQHVDHVLHLGDITSGGAAGCFSGLSMRFVRGNNDLHPALADDVARHNFPPLTDEWVGVLGGVRVAAVHGHVRHSIERLAQQADLVAHGHTHRMRADLLGKTLVVNPGALHRTLRKTIALVELPERSVTFYEVSRDEVTPVGVE